MKRNNIIALLLLFSITGCGGDVKETLGMRRDAPDEFAVERRPKLDVPPQFRITPPIEGKLVKESHIRDETRAEIFGNAPAQNTGSAENILLQKTGAANADSSIRQTIISEYGASQPNILERIESISDDTKLKTIVDAEKERERISTNKKQGKSITDGETPARTKSGTTSVLDKILGE